MVAGVGTLEVGRSRREAATAGEFVGAILRRARRWDLNKQGFCGSAAGLMATAPGGALPSRLRVALRTYVPGRASAPLRSGMVLQCFVGARRVGARLVLEAAPAEGEFEAVLELARPVFAERGDGVIVRRALPGEDASSPRRARWRSGLRRRQDWRLYRETAPRERSAHWTVATGRVLAVLDRER